MVENMNNDIIQLVTFRLEKEEFGINIFKVSEINRMINITKTPNSLEFVEGVINLRGKVIPVINLRQKLGLPKKEFDNTTKIIVVEILNKTISFIVDEVMEVLRIDKKIIEPPPVMLTGINSGYINGIAKLENRLLILLDIDKILDLKEQDELSLIT